MTVMFSSSAPNPSCGSGMISTFDDGNSIIAGVPGCRPKDVQLMVREWDYRLKSGTKIRLRRIRTSCDMPHLALEGVADAGNLCSEHGLELGLIHLPDVFA